LRARPIRSSWRRWRIGGSSFGPGIARRLLLHLHLQHIEFADAAIQDIDRNVTALITRMDQEVEAGQTRATFQSLILLLVTIPGIDVLSARIILSEIGRDMSRFRTAGHLLSCAGLCPRNDESAGKRRSTPLRKGDPWLKTASRINFLTITKPRRTPGTGCGAQNCHLRASSLTIANSNLLRRREGGRLPSALGLLRPFSGPGPTCQNSIFSPLESANGNAPNFRILS
jgi:transposase